MLKVRDAPLLLYMIMSFISCMIDRRMSLSAPEALFINTHKYDIV